jgi:peptidoglycan-associated lipoprotein
MVRIRSLGVAVVCTAIFWAGCAKKAPQIARVDPSSAVPEAPPPPPPPPPPDPASAPLPPAALSDEELFARKTLDELNAERPLEAAYFDLDQSTIRDDSRAVLQKNADWMRRWTSTRITVEGHCDSRGTSEYNLALGERRASAVKDYLVSLGIAPDRIVTVSKGKETPVCVEESESCWQQNRRGHPIITAK